MEKMYLNNLTCRVYIMSSHYTNNVQSFKNINNKMMSTQAITEVSPHTDFSNRENLLTTTFLLQLSNSFSCAITQQGTAPINERK